MNDGEGLKEESVKLYNKGDVLSERVNARLKELVHSQGPEGGAD